MTADPSLQAPDARVAVNDGRRLVGRGSDPSGRAGDREGALQLSGSSASPPHLDVYGGAGGSDGGGVRAFGESNGHANTVGAIAGNGGLSEGFPVHGPVHPRGRSVLARHVSGGPHGPEHRSRRRGSPPSDVGWMHEAERRRREGVGARDVMDRRGGPLDGRENRMMSHDRARSQHTDRMYMGAGGGGGAGFDELVRIWIGYRGMWMEGRLLLFLVGRCAGAGAIDSTARGFSHAWVGFSWRRPLKLSSLGLSQWLTSAPDARVWFEGALCFGRLFRSGTALIAISLEFRFGFHVMVVLGPRIGKLSRYGFKQMDLLNLLYSGP